MPHMLLCHASTCKHVCLLRRFDIGLQPATNRAAYACLHATDAREFGDGLGATSPLPAAVQLVIARISANITAALSLATGGKAELIGC